MKPLTRLLQQLALVRDAAEEAELLAVLGRVTRPRVVAFLNAHAANLAASDSSFCEFLHGADLVLRDGIGVKIALQSLAQEAGLNMNGTDFLPKVLRQYVGRRVALWGTSEPWLMAAAERARGLGVDVVSVRDGFGSDESYVEDALRWKPDLILLGMGMPKQERVAAKIRESAPADAGMLICCGGAILDFLGGKVERAPDLVQKLSLEWAYRLSREPGRLWRRYLVGNPVFLLQTARSLSDRGTLGSGRPWRTLADRR